MGFSKGGLEQPARPGSPSGRVAASVIRTLALRAEREGWSTEQAREMVQMLGLADPGTVSAAREGLRASRAARLVEGDQSRGVDSSAAVSGPGTGQLSAGGSP